MRLLDFVTRIQRTVRKISVSENDGSIRLFRSQECERNKKSAKHPVSKTRWNQWSCHQKCFVPLSDEDRSSFVTSEEGLNLRKWNWKKRVIRSRLSFCTVSFGLIPKNWSKYWIHIHSSEIKCTTITCWSRRERKQSTFFSTISKTYSFVTYWRILLQHFEFLRWRCLSTIFTHEYTCIC